MTDLPDRPLRRTRMASAELRAAWEEHAAEFIAWARKPGHDSYWRFHRDQFLELLPPPGRRTLDLGCGEGRLSRDLKALGHELVAVDVSPTMVATAREAARTSTHWSRTPPTCRSRTAPSTSSSRSCRSRTWTTSRVPLDAYIGALADAGLSSSDCGRPMFPRAQWQNRATAAGNGYRSFCTSVR